MPNGKFEQFEKPPEMKPEEVEREEKVEERVEKGEELFGPEEIEKEAIRRLEAEKLAKQKQEERERGEEKREKPIRIKTEEELREEIEETVRSSAQQRSQFLGDIQKRLESMTSMAQGSLEEIAKAMGRSPEVVESAQRKLAASATDARRETMIQQKMIGLSTEEKLKMLGKEEREAKKEERKEGLQKSRAEMDFLELLTGRKVPDVDKEMATELQELKTQIFKASPTELVRVEKRIQEIKRRFFESRGLKLE